MATVAAASQGMERFVKGLFQGNPDLSTLTHAIVRRKYLTHIGKETLTKEEKDRLKQLILKELVQIQVEDSGDEKLLTKLNPPAKPRGQKRTLCVSDNSGDEAESQHERKKQRTVKELEVSSSEEDSGIDSKKAQVGRGPKHAGKSLSSSDHGDSGAEGRSDAFESEEESIKNNNAPPSRRTVRKAPGSPSSKGQRGRGKGKRSGSEGEESEGGQACKPRKAKKHQMEELESNSEDVLEEVKVQKKKGLGRAKKGPDRVEKGECGKEANQRGRREIESDDESDLSETHGKERDRSGSEKVRAGGGGHKGNTTGGPKGRKAQERSQSEDESDNASREKQKKPRKATGYKHDNKDASVEESGSDSDDTEGKGQRKKNVRKTKSPIASAEKWKTSSDSEEREIPKKKVKSQGMTKAQGCGASRKELGGNQKRRSPVKQQGGHKPKRSVSRQEEKGSKPPKKGTWDSSSSENESQSEAEQRGKGRKRSEEMATSGDGSESGSEETTGAAHRPKRTSGERKGNEGASSEEEEAPTKKKGAEKSQRGSVSKVDSESDSEDLSSESPAGKGKNKTRKEKRTQKPKSRSNSKEEVRCESDEEGEQHGSSGDEASPRSSKKSHQRKEKEHCSAKGEDHPSVRRLKRYIRECGVRRNYKKLLMGCRSRKAQLEVLKQELENLGLKGTPTLAKCKALKKKREEAAEVASLDLNNIIATEGRPRRHNSWSLYSKPEKPLSSPEGSPIRRPVTDWSHLRGIISSDDESD